MRSIAPLLLVFPLGIAFAVFAACGSTPTGFGNDGGGSDSPFNLGDASGDGGSCVKCSADLHSVLDCNDNVLTTCPPDKGCGPGGSCVPACESAKSNKSTIGCDYYAVDPGTDGEANGSCFAAYIANLWTGDVTLDVEFAGQKLDAASIARIPVGSGSNITYQPLPNGKLPAGKMAILFLADATSSTNPPLPTACPIAAGYTNPNASSEFTEMIHGFHISSSAPVVAYDIFPYGGAQSYISSATLLIPTSAWDTNYVAVDAYARPVNAGATAQPFIEIAAAEDGTDVTISPTAAIVGGNGVAGTGKGVPHTYSLNRGQVLQLKQDAELNGSPIQSTKPIGVWGGNSCMDVDVSDVACDSAHQELFPVKALGYQYVAVKHKNRSGTDEKPPWRLVGAVDGTQLSYDPGPPTGAPLSINKGQLVQFSASAPFVVKSQDEKHPFYMGGYMTGQSSQGTDFGTGDPEWVNVIAPQEYLAKYIFFTDPTMKNTNLVFIRKKAGDGTFRDVSLDCKGTLGGWLPVGNGDYQYTRVDLVVNGAAQGQCNNGLHEATSTTGFGLTVWGWDTTVSYAYPSGASVLPINDVVVVPTPN